MSTQDGPIIELTITNPRTLNDIVKWARIAEDIGVPSTSRIATRHNGLAVSAFLAVVPFPADEDEEEES